MLHGVMKADRARDLPAWHTKQLLAALREHTHGAKLTSADC